MSTKRMSLPRRRQKATRIKIILILVALLSLFIGAAFFSHTPSFAVTRIMIEGARTIDEEKVRARIQEELEGNYALIFFRAHSFIYPRGDIARAIMDEFVEVRSVTLSRRGRDGIQVSLVEREEVAKWCGVAPDINVEEECFSIDKDGVIFGEARGGGVNFFGDARGGGKGGVFLPGTFADFALLVERLAGFSGRKLARVVIDDQSGAVSLFLEGGGEIIFHAHTDHLSLIEAMGSVFQSDTIIGRDFVYIDFRLPHKVYVKFEGE